MYIQNSNGTNEFYDYLSSLTALTNENGTVEQRYAYSPWGRRLNPYDWHEPLEIGSVDLKLTRGYTGHEHLDQLGIINMNGRIYDPLTAQFFSPDPYIQDGSNWLNYNRYSYCLNNPFKYTDPSGYAFGIDDAVIILLTIAGSYLGGTATNNGELNPAKWDYKNPGTYFGIGIGGFLGYVGGYWLFNPSALSVGFGLTVESPYLSAAIGIGGITTGGSMSDWNFHWTTSAGGEGYIPLKEQKPLPVPKPNKPIKNGSYFTGTEEEARQMLLDYSKTLKVETMYWSTSKGYYFEPVQGDAYGYSYENLAFSYNEEYVTMYNSPDKYLLTKYNVPVGYQKNTIKSGNIYTLVDIINGETYLYPNLFERSKIYYQAHTHPNNGVPSNTDMMTSNLFRYRGRVYGWGGAVYNYYRYNSHW